MRASATLTMSQSVPAIHWLGGPVDRGRNLRMVYCWWRQLSHRLSSLYASSDRDAGMTGRLDRRPIHPRYSGASSGLCIAHQASTYGHPRATNILLLNQPCIKQFYLTTIIRDFSFKTVREIWNGYNKWNFFFLFSRQLYLGRSGSWRFVAGGTTWIRFSSQKWMAKPFD